LTDIFLSYNREDQARAQMFAQGFEAQGLTVWWDVGLRSGEAYDEVTETALRTAKAVVVLWSRKSVQSRWVRAEATLADRNKTLVPCMIEACERPIMFELTQTAELSHWMGDAADKTWLAFLNDVRRMAAKAVTPIPQTPATTAEPPTAEETLKPGQSGSAPSLAVLPFTNRSGLPEDEVFAFGMVEDVIDALSQAVNLRVISSSATARFFSGALPDVEAIGRQLGVRYLLEGNVRRAGTDLRVTAQLVEAETGAIVWTQRFDRPLAELAALQEALVKELAACLNVTVRDLEMARALLKPSDLTAWECCMRAFSYFRVTGGTSMLQAAREARRAIELSPDYALAYAILAQAKSLLYHLLTPEDEDLVREIEGYINRAMELGSSNLVVLPFVAGALNYIGQPEAAILRANKALRINPDSGDAKRELAIAYTMLNQIDLALPHYEATFRAFPGANHMNWGVHAWMANAHAHVGDWEAAERANAECIALNPDASSGFCQNAIVLRQRGRSAEALALMVQARKLEPKATLARWEMRFNRWFPNNAAARETILGHLRALWAETEQSA
jgi:TolB-like protein